jgi:hypothetical protein
MLRTAPRRLKWFKLYPSIIKNSSDNPTEVVGLYHVLDNLGILVTQAFRTNVVDNTIFIVSYGTLLLANSTCLFTVNC